jgi:SnoaL-like domain/Pentapeptide repeats (8 copies)
VILAQAVLLVRFNASLLAIVRENLLKEGPNLSGNMKLKGEDLNGTNLQRANLQGADFEGSSFAGANLQGANLRGANLKGADLTRAINLTQEQIDSAITDDTTKRPSYIGLRPEGRTLSDFEKKAETTVKKFISAYNTFFENMNVSNLDNLLAFWAKDAELVYPTATLTGIQQIRDRYNQVREDKDWGDRKYMTGRQIVQGNVVAWEGTWKATSKPLNKTVEVPIVIMFELDSLDPQVGITLERHFYDEASLQQKLQQLQLPRPR